MAVETETFQLMKKGIIAGSLLAFTHSMGETGATIIVMEKMSQYQCLLYT